MHSDLLLVFKERKRRKRRRKRWVGGWGGGEAPLVALDSIISALAVPHRRFG